LFFSSDDEDVQSTLKRLRGDVSAWLEEYRTAQLTMRFE